MKRMRRYRRSLPILLDAIFAIVFAVVTVMLAHLLFEVL